MDPVVQSVLGGSNITNYATPMPRVPVGFAGGPQAYAARREALRMSRGLIKASWTRNCQRAREQLRKCALYMGGGPNAQAGLQSHDGPAG